jgi:zinc ribbon protein
MADRFCPSCGTEVDADARFCPTCGITLEDDQGPDLPPAPAWPRPEARGSAAETATSEAVAAADQLEPAGGDGADAAGSGPEPDPEPHPEPPSAPAGARPEVRPAAPAPAVESAVELPFTWPTTVSGWLIGIGSLLGALALIPSFGSLLSVMLFLALLGLSATVFLADRLPHVPRLRLITLVVTAIGLGIALDRSAFTVRGAESVLLLAMLAALGGALLIELDRDRPMPPPGRAGG